MRELHRPRISIPTLAPSGAGGKQAKEHRDARDKDASAVLKFPDHWKAPDVRGALYAMHGWVCAYCQCELTHSDRGDVEHQRPKNLAGAEPQVYWWLAYLFRNYLLSCRRCNSAYKRNEFPLAPNAVRVTYATRDRLADEARLLIDPVDDEVEQWMRVRWLDDEGEPLAKLIVAEGVAAGSIGYARATETIDFFNLNRDAQLEFERKQRVEDAETRYRKYMQNIDADHNLANLRRMASRYRPFGIAVRNFIEDMEPALLPTPEEELAWFLEELGKRLEVAIRQCALEVDVPDHTKRVAEEMVFALAALWRDPPTGDAGKQAVERWLTDRGIIERVRPAYVSMELRQPASVPPPSKPAPLPA